MNETKPSRWTIVVAVFSVIVRGAAMSLGALALGWGVTLTEGLGASVLAAFLGVLVGEILARRTKIKLSVIQGGAALLLLLSYGLSRFVTGAELVPSLLGPAGALTMAVFLRFGALTFCATLALRALAERKPSMVVVELAALAAAIVAVFSAHRDGVLVRPLWLSDWAWQAGFEPTQVLLGVGVGAVTMLAVLLLVQNRGGRSLAALIALAALGALAMMTINAVGLPAPQPDNDLGLITPPGQPPPRVPPMDGGDRGGNGNGEDGGGGAGGDATAEGGEGGFGGDATAEGGEGGGPGGDGSADGGEGGAGGDGSMDGGDGASSSADGGGDGSTAGGDGSDGSSSSSGDGGDGSSASASDGGDGGSSAMDSGDGSSSPMDFSDVFITPTEAGSGEGGSMPPSQPPPASEELERERQQQQQQQSSAPMAVVLLDDDYSPPSQAYYLRQTTWSEFNGSRLVPPTRAEIDRDIPRGYPTEETTLPVRPPTANHTIVHHTVALLTEHNNPFGIEGAFRFAPTRNPNPSRFQRAYRVESLSQNVPYRSLFGRATGEPTWSPELRSYYLQGPTDPRYRRLADQILSRLPPTRRNDPMSKAAAIKLWLDHELTYTTRARHAQAADPTADMLWGDKHGYCVHFAHAAVFLWRSVGLYSRIGSGYHVDEAQRGGGSTLIVRSSDGHAWPEIYLQGYGWLVMDIAAEHNEDPPGQPQDDDERSRLGQMAREQPPDPQQPPQRQPEQQRPSQGKAKAAAKAMGFFLLLVLLALYAVKIWRRLIPSFVKGREAARTGYRAALDVLAEAGLTRKFGETREAFARRVSEQTPSLASLSALSEEAKLGSPTAPAPAESASREALSKVRREVAGARPFWRRMLGLLHPASFLDSN